LATGPSPLRAPFDAGAGGAVEVRALRAGCCGVFAPEVVKNFVAGFGVVGVERAEADGGGLDGGGVVADGSGGGLWMESLVSCCCVEFLFGLTLCYWAGEDCCRESRNEQI
jgi:hypothetical protein